MVEELYELAERVDRNQEAAERLEGDEEVMAEVSQTFSAVKLARETISNYDVDMEQVLEDMGVEDTEKACEQGLIGVIGGGIEECYESATEFVDEYAGVNA